MAEEEEEKEGLSFLIMSSSAYRLDG